MIKLIQSPTAHQGAINRIAELMDKNPPDGSAQADELLVLAKLVELYEKEQHDIGLPDAISAIRFRMEQQGLTNADMVSYLGSPSRVSEVLNGKRPLTMAMIRNLHLSLGLPLEALVLNGVTSTNRQTRKRPLPQKSKPKRVVRLRTVMQKKKTSRMVTSS
jgi:HTH-type transcriptional regulator/antitoxin HigA